VNAEGGAPGGAGTYAVPRPAVEQIAVEASITKPGTPARFDRERIVLYVAAFCLLASVWGAYALGFYLPTRSYAQAIVDARLRIPAGCYLHYLEHANIVATAISLRFAIVIVGAVVAFIGAFFTIKGLEAAYSLDVGSSEKQHASLRTSSPGLVLCTLGLALCLAALMHSDDFSFQETSQCLAD